MKQPAALIAFGIAISFTAQAYASAETGLAAAAISVAAPAATIGDGSPRTRTALRGVVASVDERDDRITLRLSPHATAELRVRDGLLFNAVRYGDRVEVTVEDINGTKTIVGLTKQ